MNLTCRVNKTIISLSIVAALVLLRGIETSIPLVPYGPVYYKMGLGYAGKGHKAKAMDYYRKAVHSDPNFADAYYRMGEIYGDQKRYEMALANLKKAIDVNPQHHQAYTALGHIYRSLGDYEKALAAFRKANAFCAQYPYAPQYLFNSGGIYLDMGDKGKVLNVIKDLDLMGESRLAYELKIRVFLEMSEMEK